MADASRTPDPTGDANFAVYKAKGIERTYLVVSTSASPRGTEKLERPEEFESGDALPRLAEELKAAFTGAPVPLTLKVHGFNTRRKDLENEILNDADPRRRFRNRTPPPNFRPEQETFRPDGSFFIGYRWPSEGILTAPSWRDAWAALLFSPLIGWALLLLPILGLLWTTFGSDAWLATKVGWKTVEALRALSGPYLNLSIASWIFGTGAMLLGLRLSTYGRDRYRALHYGVPDLGEFMRALEERLHADRVQVKLSVIGHSMGTLVLINAFRVMSDFFSNRDPDGSPRPSLGRDDTFQLGTMVLCGADIPSVMATPDRNNYFLSVLRRFAAIHVFSSDRDIILKWLSLIGNWTSEPRYDMAGRKLGNTLLIRTRAPAGVASEVSPAQRLQLWPVNRPVWQPFPIYEHNPNPDPKHEADLHFYDCTLDYSLTASMGYVTGATFVVAVILGCTWFIRVAILHWLSAAFVGVLILGLIGRALWPHLRDQGKLGGFCGMFADWPQVLLIGLAQSGCNPHSGYFMFMRPPRQRIASLIRDPAAWPPRPQDGGLTEELDEPIRYRRIKLSV